MKKKLFLISLVVLLGFPIYIVGGWVYGNRQIVAKAENYFREIPKYENIIEESKENAHSISSLGYAKAYSTRDSWESISSFYKSNIPNTWTLKSEGVKSLLYESTVESFVLSVGYLEGSNDVNSFVVSISEKPK